VQTGGNTEGGSFPENGVCYRHEQRLACDLLPFQKKFVLGNNSGALAAN